MIAWLTPNDAFPPVEAALREPNGLLAAGSDLSVRRLLAAYSLGIFPWFSEGDPVLWWSPDPRMVLFTDEFRLHRSLRQSARRARRHALEIRLDTAFDEVMCLCAARRRGQTGTWITDDMRAAYGELHRLELAHSVEVWRSQRLVGGLYGVAVGKMFYGESMFSLEPDASKLALAALVQLLRNERVPVIDCQQRTDHLASLGAREIPRQAFCQHVLLSTRLDPVSWVCHRGTNLLDLIDD